VLALVALSTVGLAIFGVTTYSLYHRFQERQLDQQLEATSRGQAVRLRRSTEQFDVDPRTCEPAVASGRSTATTVQTSGRRPPRPAR